MYGLMGKSLTTMWGLRSAGTQTDRHRHPHEQIALLIKGRLDCRIGDGPVTHHEAGETILIPGGTDHEFWYREDCEIIEVFSPPRHDLFPEK